MTTMTKLAAPMEVTAASAKARFAECVRTAEQGRTVVITKHGRRVVALVPADDIDELRRLRAAGPAAGLAGVAGGWRGSDTLQAHLRRFKRTRSRRLPRVD
jgi:prevent-host-death family protein